MIYEAYYDTKIGGLKISCSEDSLISIEFSNIKENKTSNPNKLSQTVINQINEYLEGSRKTFDIPLMLDGTQFQKKVWKALLDIPYGETRSYKDIAEIIGNPKAVRAVGMANNKNKIPILIPCHRVIGSRGDLVGYAGGLEIKKSFLEIEKDNKCQL